MQETQTVDSRSTKIQEAIDRLEKAKRSLLESARAIPPERHHWSPAPSARTPAEIVHHAATSIGHILAALEGKTFDVGTPEAADAAFREAEHAVNSMEEVLATFEARCEAYVDWLSHLDEAKLGRQFASPFGMDPVPIEDAAIFAAMHTEYHVPQLDYIQTAYGDRVWRF